MDAGPGVLCFGGGGAVPVGETHHRADRHPPPKIPGGLADITGRDTDRGHAVTRPVVTDLPDVRPGGSLAEKGVVHTAKDFLLGHTDAPFGPVPGDMMDPLYHKTGPGASGKTAPVRAYA